MAIVKRHRINKQDLFDRVVKYIIENVENIFKNPDFQFFEKVSTENFCRKHLQLFTLAEQGIY